ncbi:hypothetical protein HPB49_022904 [Dermacentor silvarum]|uniref:Uncharacterized protein n=1 Tax=Dermacentor silvarum TaxID=543639 RepID=A0ACB8DGE9_DERSI|nr:hypothetical protein HPB49_022904 [Dermacentor silvarum]
MQRSLAQHEEPPESCPQTDKKYFRNGEKDGHLATDASCPQRKLFAKHAKARRMAQGHQSRSAIQLGKNVKSSSQSKDLSKGRSGSRKQQKACSKSRPSSKPPDSGAHLSTSQPSPVSYASITSGAQKTSKKTSRFSPRYGEDIAKELEQIDMETEVSTRDFENTLSRLQKQLSEIQRFIDTARTRFHQQLKERNEQKLVLQHRLAEWKEERTLIDQAKRRQSLSPRRGSAPPPKNTRPHPVNGGKLKNPPQEPSKEETGGSVEVVPQAYRAPEWITQFLNDTRAQGYVPHAKLDTAKYCSKIKEVVAVRCKLSGRQTLLVSAYFRPETNCYKKCGAKKANFAWLRELRNIFPKDRLLVGGYFNAHHQSWGYDINSERGCLLLEEVEAAGIILANDLDYPTRHALHSGQRDSTPDLTGTTPGLVNDWRCGADPMGSDHYPIWIEVEAKATGQKKRMTSAVDWDLFRSCFEASDKNTPFLEKLSSAARKATRNIEVNEHLPTPDKHLLHLWDTRAMLHQVYIQNGKQHVDLLKVRKTAQARRYAKELDRERWCDHCASFDDRTGTRKLWSTFKGMSGKRKKCNIVRNVMLATGCSPSEFELKAAHTFFPQPDLPPDAKIYQRMVPTSEADIESAFTMQELIMALDSVNAKSSPGKDGITRQLLRNLSERGKEQLKEEINKVWLSGEIPVEWKHSVVSPIPKPGRPANDVSILRPISLTSTLRKLLERLVVTRLTYHLEESHNEPYFDPSQTGFRPGLCTQDSLFLLCRCTRKRRGRQKVPGILVAADLRKAFDSVTHEAVISTLEE